MVYLHLSLRLSDIEFPELWDKIQAAPTEMTTGYQRVNVSYLPCKYVEYLICAPRLG
jgi:hypothetical protein